MPTYQFSLNGTLSGSISGAFFQDTAPTDPIANILSWRDVSKLVPTNEMVISTTSSLALASGRTLSGSFTPSYSDKFVDATIPMSMSGSDIVLNGKDIGQLSEVFIPADSWVSGTAFTVFADVFRPDNFKIKFNPTVVLSGSYFLTEAAGTIETASFTISPFSPRSGDNISSKNGTGASDPMTITFSSNVYGARIVVQDPTFAGNTAVANNGCSEEFDYSGVPGLNTPSTRFLTGSFSEIVITPASADYIYFSVLVFMTQADYDAFDSVLLEAVKFELPYSVADNTINYFGGGSGFGFTIDSGTIEDGTAIFWWSDTHEGGVYNNTKNVVYSGSNYVDINYTSMGSGDKVVNSYTSMYANVEGLQRPDGTFVTSSNASRYEWPQGTWKRMGMDVIHFTNVGEVIDVKIGFWLADAFTGNNKVTFTTEALYQGSNYTVQDMNWNYGFDTEWMAKVLNSASVVRPILFVANSTSGSCDWKFRNLTITENFRDVVTGSIIGKLTGSYGGRLEGFGLLSGSSRGLAEGTLVAGGADLVTTASVDIFPNMSTFFNGPAFDSIVEYSWWSVFSIPDAPFNTQYFYRSRNNNTVVTASSFEIGSPNLAAVTITQYGATMDGNLVRAFDITGSLISSSIFTSGTSTQRLQRNGSQRIARVETAPVNSEYVYFAGPAFEFFDAGYSGSIYGVLDGRVRVTSSFSLLGTETEVSGTLARVRLTSMSLKYGLVQAPAPRRGVFIQESSGSPHLSLEPLTFTSSWHLVGDVWMSNATGSVRGLYYADYSSSLTTITSSIVPFRVLTTTGSRTEIDGGTF